LKRLNASCWEGPHDRGRRLPVPSGEAEIPALEEVLSAFAGKVGLNIQVYADRKEALDTIVRLYLHYDLRASGFLMLRTFAEAERVRALSPDVALCVGEDRVNLERHLSFGVDYVQPTRQCLTEPFVLRLQETGIPANVFYANDRDIMAELMARKIPGIMTDIPDVLLDLIHSI
jgi:glycerophosphoryl diester phosphodiesterase